MNLVAPRFLAWLGAPAKFAMALPDAQPSQSQMYCPRGVYLDDRFLIVADSGNHRVLIWKLSSGLPGSHSDADVVLGQPDFLSEGPKLFHLPTGVTMVGDCLLVADAWHHRILGWNKLPENGTEPDFVIGQSNFTEVQPNRGRKEPTAETLYWPYGLAYVDGKLYVADTGNRRVVYWTGLPRDGRPAEGLLGQNNFAGNEENRGAIGPNSFRWAHDIAGSERHLFVADAGNHRVLGWQWSNLQGENSPADLLLGQSDFDRAEEYPYRPQSAQVMRFPYSISYCAESNEQGPGLEAGGVLAVADTANNRVLIFDQIPSSGLSAAAQRVIGQPDFKANGENNWKAVTENSLCWPYGIHLYRPERPSAFQVADGAKILAIADSGNNRVMLWEI